MPTKRKHLVVPAGSIATTDATEIGELDIRNDAKLNAPALTVVSEKLWLRNNGQLTAANLVSVRKLWLYDGARLDAAALSSISGNLECLPGSVLNTGPAEDIAIGGLVMQHEGSVWNDVVSGPRWQREAEARAEAEAATPAPRHGVRV